MKTRVTVRGHLYEPGSSERAEATLTLECGRFRLIRADDTAGIEVEVRKASDRLAGIPQALTLGTGQRFLPLEELPWGFLDATDSGMSRWLVWLERFSPIKTVALVALLALGLLGLRAAVPVVADYAAPLIPDRAEAFIGRQAFRELDAVMFEPSRIDALRRGRIDRAARALARQGGTRTFPEVRFRHAPLLGANAFAFPGGPILITDDLVRVLGDDDRILAVIAHELGHVEERHGLRQVLRAGGMFLVASLVLGGDDSLMEELAAVATSTATAGYSRDFERDADAFAGRLLESTGRSAGDLADALEALMEDCGKPCEGEESWLSTHPGTASRIQALREQQ